MKGLRLTPYEAQNIPLKLVDNSKPTFRMVQALRGVAASMVLMHHAAQTWMSKARGVPFNSEWINLASGVDIFFVISGFVMAISAADARRRPTAAQFMVRRVLRIAPMYWIVTFLMMGKLIAGRTSAQPSAHFSMGYVLSSLAFLPWRSPLGHYGINPILPVGWTLYYEMFFYLLLAFALLFNMEPLRWLAPLLLLLSFAGIFHKESWPAVTLFFSPLLLEFLCGFCLAYMWNRGFRFNRMVCWLLMGVGFACLIMSGDSSGPLRAVLWGIPSLLIVFASVFLEPAMGGALPNLALNVGDASYSLYLIHPLIIAFLMASLVHAHHVPRTESPFVLLCLVVSIACALALYRSLERPLTRELGILAKRTHKWFIAVTSPKGESAKETV